MEEAQKVPSELKTLITKPLVLALPELGESLLYVTTTNQVIYAAIVVEREEPRHVYKVHCETHYNQVQKLLYAILIMKHKLLHYLESHPVYVVTSHGLGKIVGNRFTTGRIVK
jgi:hypothetical protein